MVVFFFKQKTAYEMRISDWSSDVCSSDLTDGRRRGGTTRDRLDGDVELVPHVERVVRPRAHVLRLVLDPTDLLEVGELGDLGLDLLGRRGIEPLDTGDRELLAVLPLLSVDHQVPGHPSRAQQRSEERRVGQEGVSRCRSRWSTYH